MWKKNLLQTTFLPAFILKTSPNFKTINEKTQSTFLRGSWWEDFSASRPFVLTCGCPKASRDALLADFILSYAGSSKLISKQLKGPESVPDQHVLDIQWPKGMSAGLQVTEVVAYFQPSLNHGSGNPKNIMWLRAGNACWSLSLGPFPILNLSSIPPDSRTPLVSLLLHCAAGAAHFWSPRGSWVQWFLLKPFLFFPISAAAYRTTNLSPAVGSSEEERVFPFAARSSCPVIHASIHLLAQGQHPSWAFSISHIFHWLLFCSFWTTEYSSCPPTRQTTQYSFWTVFHKPCAWT